MVRLQHSAAGCYKLTRQLSEEYGLRDIKNTIILTVLTTTCSRDEMKCFLHGTQQVAIATILCIHIMFIRLQCTS